MKVFFHKLVMCAVLLAGARSRACAAAAAWPQFRGHNGDGLGLKAKPPIKIGPSNGVLWRVEVPWSPSSPCVWGDHIFLTTFEDGQLQTRCYDRRTGGLVWTRSVKVEKLETYHNSEGSPAAATPATDGDRVVSYFGSFGLVCYDFKGNEVWKHPLPLAQSHGGFGSGTSPIIAARRFVILNP